MTKTKRMQPADQLQASNDYRCAAHLDEADCKGVRLDLADELLAHAADELVGGAEDEDVRTTHLQHEKQTTAGLTQHHAGPTRSSTPAHICETHCKGIS
jgi:hypothetical protein